MQKSIQFSLTQIFIVGVLFSLGIFFNPAIICDFQLWVVISATILMFSSQPKLSKSDFNNPDDKFSMLFISIMAIIVTNLTTIEWALQTKENFKINFIKGVGFCMIWGGLAFRIYAIKMLSIYFSNASTIKSEHKLIDKGIYAIIRHPSYTGAILSIVGIIVWLESWKTLPISIILIGLAYGYRIIQEEAMLLKHFGEKYKKYRQNTGALLPKFFSYRKKQLQEKNI